VQNVFDQCLCTLLFLLPIQPLLLFFQHRDQQDKSKYSNHLLVLVAMDVPMSANPKAVFQDLSQKVLQLFLLEREGLSSP
jgi:hypothetical protein